MIRLTYAGKFWVSYIAALLLFAVLVVGCATAGQTAAPIEIRHLYQGIVADWTLDYTTDDDVEGKHWGKFRGACQAFHDVASARARNLGLTVGVAIVIPENGDEVGHIAAVVLDKKGTAWIVDSLGPPRKAW